MKIGIIGVGNMGGGIGKLLAVKGYEVLYGARDVNSDKVKNLIADSGLMAKAVSVNEAAQSADVVILAVPMESMENALESAGDLSGKVLVECTNPVTSDFQWLSIGTDNSAAEEAARLAPGSKVVKAFNAVGQKVLSNPEFGSLRADLFICGDDDDAKAIVKKLGEDMGFNVVDTGGLACARLLEPLAMLGIRLAVHEGMGGEIAFKILTR